MKIAIIYDAIYPYIIGGGEKRIYEISKKLSKNHEIHLFGMKYWDGEDIINKNGVYLHGVCKPVNLYNKKGRRNIIQPLYFSLKLITKLMNQEFDLIECQNFPFFPCFISKIYSVIKKRPLVITWLEIWNKDTWSKYGIIGYFGEYIEKLSFKLTNKNIILTPEIPPQLNGESMFIPFGIDLEKIKKIKPSKENFDILFAGRLIKEKNVDLLLRAIKGLDIKVGIIGNGPEEKNLKNLARNLRINNVKFIDFFEKDEDMYSYMKSSKLFVSPSEREGFGIVILEALTTGCGVITIDHQQNNAKYLVNKRFICKPTVKSLRNKIIYGLHNKYYNKVNLKNFDINKTVKQTEEYYLRCINEK